MGDVNEKVRTALESGGYDVGEVAQNRETIRVTIHETDASASDIRRIVHDALGESDVYRLDVTTESLGGGQEVSTVISFRYRG